MIMISIRSSKSMDHPIYIWLRNAAVYAVYARVLVIEQAMDGVSKCCSCTGLSMLRVTASRDNKVGKSLTK